MQYTMTMNKCKIVFLVGKKMVCNLPCLNMIRDIQWILSIHYNMVSSTQHTMWIDLTFVSKCFNRIWLQKASLSSENYLLPHVIIGSPYVRVSKTNHNRRRKNIKIKKDCGNISWMGPFTVHKGSWQVSGKQTHVPTDSSGAHNWPLGTILTFVTQSKEHKFNPW